jgi:hypothetical protein
MNTAINTKQIEDTARQVFAISKELQAEFGGDEVAYIAFKKAEARGQVRIFGKPTSEMTGGNSVAAENSVPAKTEKFSIAKDVTVSAPMISNQVSPITRESSGVPGQVYSERRKCFVSDPALI